MSCYHSTKCTKEELANFKKEVINFLEEKGYDTKRMKIRAFNCYGGDVRVYTGGKNEFPNHKQSIRKADNGNYYKSLYSREYIEYVAFSRDEFKKDILDDIYLEELLSGLEKFKK